MKSTCDMCGKNWARSNQFPCLLMRKLRPDDRSGIQKALFSRKPDDFSDYDKIFICEECLGRAQVQGWMEYKRIYD